jgi:hypothetical protein
MTNPFPTRARAHELYQRIVAERPRFRLAPGPEAATDWARELVSLNDEELLGAPCRDRDMAISVRSGLLLRADLLDASHDSCQRITTTTGSYWHAILHRREGDFDNAKYWFHRVGDHSIYADLLAAVRIHAPGIATSCSGTSAGPKWRSDRFVDLCATRHRGPQDALGLELETVQNLEMELLLGYSAARAVSL